MLLSRKNRNHSQLDHNISTRELRYQLRGLLMERINSNFMVYIWVSLKLKRNCFHKASCCSKLNFRTWKTNCLTFPIISLIRLKNKQNTILKSKRKKKNRYCGKSAREPYAHFLVFINKALVDVWLCTILSYAVPTYTITDQKKLR